MAIYGDGKHDKGVITTLKRNMKEKSKQEINKEILIGKVLRMLRENIYEYEDFIFDLVKESLKTRTQKELKELL
jgi:hypothetical protein